jgi:hypothetical protein
MGFFDKVKGFLNVGGPKVAILQIDQPISGKFGVVSGTAKVTTTRPAKIAKFTQKFVRVTTTGTGDEKQVETTIIAENEQLLDIEVKDTDPCDLSIHISYDASTISDRMAKKGGVMGAIGKVGQFTSGLQPKGIEDYFVEVGVDVVGTPLDPTDKQAVRANLND